MARKEVSRMNSWKSEMVNPRRKVVWYQYVEGSPNMRESELLERIPIEDAQFEWLLQKYVIDNLWPTVPDFDGFVRAQLAASEIPSNLSCLAYLSKHPKLVELADKLETLQGAWGRE